MYDLQGSGVECFASQPGLVQTQLNMRKLDHSKLTSNLLDISTRIYGQRADRASLCLQRPASDPTVTGVFHITLNPALFNTLNPSIEAASRVIGIMMIMSGYWFWQNTW